MPSWKRGFNSAALPVPLVRGEVPLPEGPRASALPAPPVWGSSVEGRPGPARRQIRQRSPH